MTSALATEALEIEGITAYFPTLDPSTFDAIDVLSEYLTAHTDLWTAASDESAWEFNGSLADLEDLAMSLGGLPQENLNG